MPRIHLMLPIRPLFAMAVVFGGILRILDCYLLAASTRPGFIRAWQEKGDMAFALSDGVRVCCLLFLMVAFAELFLRPRSLAGWASLVVCALLAVYGCGLDFSPDDMAGWEP